MELHAARVYRAVRVRSQPVANRFVAQRRAGNTAVTALTAMVGLAAGVQDWLGYTMLLHELIMLSVRGLLMVRPGVMTDTAAIATVGIAAGLQLIGTLS